MKTKFELSEEDIKKVIAEKFSVNPKSVEIDVTHYEADRPWESASNVVSATVTMANADVTFNNVVK